MGTYLVSYRKEDTMDINKFLRETIGDMNFFLYDLIVWLSKFFPCLKW